MDDGLCADCTTLHQAALDAIIRHTYTQGRLAIAKLQHNSLQIGVLEPVVEHLVQERSAAVRAYQEHTKTHAEEAVSPRTT